MARPSAEREERTAPAATSGPLDDATRRALRALYDEVDALVAARDPRCEMSGRCCDFPRSGHQLWASELEAAFAVDARGGDVPAAPSGQCAWYVDGTCRNREGRPLGCRLYFCDPSWAPEMPEHYERFHAALKALHDRAGWTYRYRLFTEAIGAPRPTEAPET